MPTRPADQTSDWRERRRLQAWQLHLQGWSQNRIAEELGVTQGAVSQWIKRVHEGGGIAALRRNLASGRRTKLTQEQFAQLPSVLARGAESFGFRGDHWSTRRIAVVLQEVFDVSYHPGSISRLLRKHFPNWRTQQNRKGE